jgi:hypothetical protein
MISLGIELEGAVLRWVTVHGTAAAFVVGDSGRIKLSATRDRNEIQIFANAVKALLNRIEPAAIGIKEKPEGKGRMTAGSAALKMEAIVLYFAPVDPVFISGARINKCAASDPNIKKDGPEEPAFKAAICVLPPM